MRDFEIEEQTEDEMDAIMEERRRRRRAERRRRRRRQARIKRAIVLACMALVLVLLIVGIVLLVKKATGKKAVGTTATTVSAVLGETRKVREQAAQAAEDQEDGLLTGVSDKEYSIGGRDTAKYLGSENVTSTRALMVDADSMTAVAQRGAAERINPASMTKILTLLVAAEHATNLDDTFTVTIDITDYSYSNDCSSAGFAENETVTVRDLMYGTILPSGGDAAAALAIYTAGSLDAFVDMMNERLQSLGLSGTAHFTNCVGLYDENHYCTLYDMAVILAAAADNEICRDVLTAHTYTTSSTKQHPDGITLSNWFLRKIEDKDTHGEVLYAKTGYVVQSGNCAASYEVTNSGRHYICVTADAHSSWRCIYDHVAAYQEYTE